MFGFSTPISTDRSKLLDFLASAGYQEVEPSGFDPRSERMRFTVVDRDEWPIAAEIRLGCGVGSGGCVFRFRSDESLLNHGTYPAYSSLLTRACQ